MGIMNISEIMDRSIDILRKYIKTIILFNLGYGAIMILVYILIVIGFSIFSVIFFSAFSGTFTFIASGIIMFLITSSVIFSSYVGIIKITNQEFGGENIHAGGAIGSALRSVMKVFGIVFSGTLAFIPIFGVVAALVYTLYKAITKTSNTLFNITAVNNITIIILSVLVFILIIAVLIFFNMVIIFSIHSLVLEDNTSFKAIKRSRELIKNNFWKIFFINIIFYLAVSAISLSLQSFIGIISGLVYMIMKYLNINMGYQAFITMIYTDMQWPLTLLTWVIITPIRIIMISLLYTNQRFKKEGYDLVLRVKNLGKAGETNASF